MKPSLLELLRCPMCATRLELRTGAGSAPAATVVETGVLHCECNRYPVVYGIPVLRVDELSAGVVPTSGRG
jgi:uncharacterized protein YbaR (Trm112 family)